MAPPIDTARIRAHLEKAARVRRELWPVYRRGVLGATSAHEAVTVHSDVQSRFEAMAGAGPLVVPVAFDAMAHAHMLAAFDYRCAYCGGALQVTAQTTGRLYADIAMRIDCAIDHVDPKSLGGLSTYRNYVPACGRCNREKAARTPEQWARDTPR